MLKAPLVPVEKFSRDLTVFFSSGTEVPPDVIRTRVWPYSCAMNCTYADDGDVADVSDAVDDII